MGQPYQQNGACYRSLARASDARRLRLLPTRGHTSSFTTAASAAQAEALVAGDSCSRRTC